MGGTVIISAPILVKCIILPEFQYYFTLFECHGGRILNEYIYISFFVGDLVLVGGCSPVTR